MENKILQFTYQSVQDGIIEEERVIVQYYDDSLPIEDRKILTKIFPINSLNSVNQTGINDVLTELLTKINE